MLLLNSVYEHCSAKHLNQIKQELCDVLMNDDGITEHQDELLFKSVQLIKDIQRHPDECHCLTYSISESDLDWLMSQLPANLLDELADNYEDVINNADDYELDDAEMSSVKYAHSEAHKYGEPAKVVHRYYDGTDWSKLREAVENMEATVNQIVNK